MDLCARYAWTQGDHASATACDEQINRFVGREVAFFKAVVGGIGGDMRTIDKRRHEVFAWRQEPEGNADHARLVIIEYSEDPFVPFSAKGCDATFRMAVGEGDRFVPTQWERREEVGVRSLALVA